MSLTKYLQDMVNEYFEIRQIKNVISSIHVYGQYAKPEHLDTLKKAESFFIHVLGERRIEIMKQFSQADIIRANIQARMKLLPAFERNSEMSCIICKRDYILVRYTNLFGRTCERCGAENAVFPTWLIQTAWEAVIPPTVGGEVAGDVPGEKTGGQE